MGKNLSYPSQKGNQKRSSSSGQARVQNIDSMVRSHSRMQNSAKSFDWQIENDLRSVGLSNSRSSTFPSIVDKYIHSSHRRAPYSRSYPSYDSMVNNYTISDSGSSLGTALGWSRRLDSAIRSYGSHK